MGDFKGTKPKSNYNGILHLEDGTIDGNEKKVQDGRGNDTALEISTGKIKSTGDIEAVGGIILGTASSTTDEAFPVVVRDTNTGLLKSRIIGGSTQDNYDSGWLDFFNAALSDGYGTLDAAYTNHPNPPQFRVINRMVLFRGELLLPLNDGADNYVVDFNDTVTTFNNQAGLYTEQYYSTVGGGSSNVRTLPLLNSDILYPDTVIRKEGNGFANRRVKEKNSTDGLNLSAYINRMIFSTDGTLTLQGIGDIETPNQTGLSSSRLQMSQARYLTTRVEADDYPLNFTLAKTSASSAGGASLLNPVGYSTQQYPLTFDGTSAIFWGGCRVSLDNCFYFISKDTTIAQIEAAVNEGQTP